MGNQPLKSAPKKRKSKRGSQTLPFGKILRQEMEERDLTVRAVAEMSGVSPSVVQGWLNDVSPHNLYAVAQLAEVLGMSFKGLLLGEREARSTSTSMSEVFEESEVIEGIYRVKMQLLVPRSKKKAKPE